MNNLTDDIEDDNNGCSIERKYIYLEQLRDYIYKDVVLADTKAGFSLTIVTVSVAAAITLFKEPNIYWIIGLVFTSLSVLCSMLTVLPRSYVTHTMASNPDHWVNLKSGWRHGIVRRYKDAYYVLFENLWQKQTQGTTHSLKKLLATNSDEDLVNILNDSMQRAFIAQTLKYLWVGKALLFAFLAFCFIGMSLLLTVDKPVNTNSSILKVQKVDNALNIKAIPLPTVDKTVNTNSSMLKAQKVGNASNIKATPLPAVDKPVNTNSSILKVQKVGNESNIKATP